MIDPYRTLWIINRMRLAAPFFEPTLPLCEQSLHALLRIAETSLPFLEERTLTETEAAMRRKDLLDAFRDLLEANEELTP